MLDFFLRLCYLRAVVTAEVASIKGRDVGLYRILLLLPRDRVNIYTGRLGTTASAELHQLLALKLAAMLLANLFIARIDKAGAWDFLLRHWVH